MQTSVHPPGTTTPPGKYHQIWGDDDTRTLSDGRPRSFGVAFGKFSVPSGIWERQCVSHACAVTLWGLVGGLRERRA